MRIFFLFLLLNTLSVQAFCQDSASLEFPVHTRIFRATIVPVALIGYSFTTIGDRGLYSSNRLYHDIQAYLPGFHTNVDSWLRFAPIAGLAAFKALDIAPSRNDNLNTLALTAKSHLLMSGFVYAMKYSFRISRPDGTDALSFPSGHTALAFTGAALFSKEYSGKSIWYGVLAYTLASATGVLRVMKNEHWLADVVAGAGIGILSVNLVYLTHQHKWNRKSIL